MVLYFLWKIQDTFFQDYLIKKRKKGSKERVYFKSI